MENSFETEATGGRDGVGELGSRDGEEAAVGRGLGHGGEEVPEVAASHGHGAETAGAGGMTALIQLLLAQQGEERRRREEDEQRRLQEERRRRDDEDRRRREEYQLQLETLRGVLERTAEGSPARPVDPGEHVKLTRFTENEDIEAYLTTFERVMTLGRVPNEAWTMRLAPQLSGKALQAYAATPTADAADYPKVKEAILRRYDVSEETYRQRFRSERKKMSETYKGLAVRLQDLACKWMAGCSSVQEVIDKLVVEQLFNTMPKELRVWLAERKPTSGEESGQMADDYVQARRHVREARPDDKEDRKTGGTAPSVTPSSRKCYRCGAEGHVRSNCPVKDEPAKDGPTEGKSKPRGFKNIKCYNCGKYGHISANCPEKASFFCGDGRGRSVARKGRVEGTRVCDILLDTGCTRTMVRSDLVLEESFLPGEAVTILCAHGDTAIYPLARVRMEVEGVGMEVKAAVSDSLPVAALLGTDVPQLGALLHANPLAVHTPGMDHALVVTRAQARREAEETGEAKQRQISSGVRPHTLASNDPHYKSRNDASAGPEGDCGGAGLVEVEGGGGVITGGGRGGGGAGDRDDEEQSSSEQPTDNLEEGEDTAGATSSEENWGSWLADDLFNPGVTRPKQSRAEKRDTRRTYGLERAKDRPSRELSQSSSHLEGLDITQEELKTLQRTDEDLAGLAKGGGRFFISDGILYRHWTPRGRGECAAVEQMVLPKKCRKAVLHLAHTNPLGGHLGKAKTAARIQQRFYWPSLFRDVADYCRSCPQCQKSGRRRVPRAPLIPLPVMSEPFERIAMDVVGPLPRSRSGHRYVLVICDYGTRYPEAIPMKTVDAEAVAEELLKLFSRVGIPREILTDQGTNFTSQLLGELYRLLGVKALRTTPYHPQTDGLVERFNGTLKAMLRKSAREDGKDWDKLLPYVLFAYREVPQESTGFSPFELLYGRDVRGPLDVIKGEWEASLRSDQSVVSHILLTRERMEGMMELVQENIHQAQRQQKMWYDRSARERTFNPGEQVLVLLPTTTSKLTAQWQGPYQVLQQVGPVDYSIATPDRRKKKTLFHINMLREWKEPEQVGYFAVDPLDTEEELEALTWDGGEDGQPVFGEQLTSVQREELNQVLKQYQDIMTKIPGHTNLTQHRIETTDHAPIRLPPYRLPQAYRETVRQELEEMQQQGVIEPATSEWAAPIVIVRKKDGSIRLCVDYRRLNTITRSDAYPMPRIDDLIDQIGQAQYLSTLDLTKGYWQVPVAEEDQAKTAFTTPFGLFTFRRMPFGLQGAPATFQRMVDRLLEGLGAFTGAYLDDVVIFSNTWGEHLQHLRAVFDRLRGAGLTAKPKKCQLGMAHCVYLGHVVGGGKVQAEKGKVDAVNRMGAPKTKKEVRAFLGLTGYYRKFIPNYASVATPLTDLTRKSCPNRPDWTADCEEAFQKLKQLLCSAPVLRTPDFERPFLLQTDASDRGVGAVLSQPGVEAGTDHPVAYFSKKLLPREEKYSTVEKECLAIKLATQAFRVYLLGRHFTIQTDHRALEWLDRVKESNGRLTRWSLALQPFSFTVEYRPGGQNGNADGLSRLTEEFEDSIRGNRHGDDVAGEGGRSVKD